LRRICLKLLLCLYRLLSSAQIHQTVTAGGKVLVPVFAVGRAQELLLLLDEHWQRTELEVRGGNTCQQAALHDWSFRHCPIVCHKHLCACLQQPDTHMCAFTAGAHTEPLVFACML
jgi:hypothetical protein